MIENKCKFEEGEKVVGLKQVVKSLQNNELKTLYIATDCDSFIEKKVLPLTDEKVLVVRMFTQEELGEASNIDVNAAVVGILKK